MEMEFQQTTATGAFDSAPMDILTQQTLQPDEALSSHNLIDRFSRLDSFLAAFGFAEDTSLYIRALPPKGAHDFKPVKLMTTRKQLNGDFYKQRDILYLNQTHGLYFVVNEGGDKGQDINRFTAFFVESDTASIDEQHRRLDAAPIQPSIRVMTKKSVHAYWLIKGNCTANDWRNMQRRLIDYFDGDRAINDLSRVMRLPFFDHLSINKETSETQRKQVELNAFEPQSLYTLEQMCAAFPETVHGSHKAEFDSQLAAEIYDEFSVYPHNPQRDRELAKECLPYLSKERCDEYFDWLNVGIALCNIFGSDDEGLDLWREWSQQSQKYIEGDCDDKWHTFDSREFGIRLGVGSLIMWAREDSTEYRALEDKRRTERRIDIAEHRAEEAQHTDLGNARRLVRRHGANIRYDYKRKRWFAWDETRWIENAENAVMQLAKETVTALYKEAADIEDQDKRQALTKHALKSEAVARLKAMVDLARDEPEIQVDVAAFDSASHLMNVLNGTLDLCTGELRPHSREDLLTKIVPINYSSQAACPQWDTFLSRIFNGNQNLIRFMRRAIGYTLTGETGEQCMFVLHGTGANGKSTLLEVVATLAAGYGIPVRTEALMKHKWSGASGHNEDIANLRGARFVSAVETEAGHKLAESLLKQITGGDTITASRKHEHSVTFRPSFKLWLAANHKPEVDGTDEGIWRRIHLVPFGVTIPEPERDRRLSEKLRAEISGILSWCVSGAVEYYRDGLGVVEEVKKATAAYRDEQDTLSDFLADRCEVGNGLTAKIGELYQAYETWCSTNGEKALNRKVFKAQLLERGFEDGRGTGGVRIWRGLAICNMFGLSAIAA